ncbi:MAG: cysteine peptidase family C39 domain-containing protein [Planctomycetota bacterium]|nr:cysteine peptidase family C39 domain-containing protein [Planctomycetota bacterium]
MPSILQMEAVECGAASLAMILAYYGRWIPLADLRLECGVTRDGSNAGQLAVVARSHGLTAKGKRLDLEELRSSSPRPLILFWGFGHFVVFEGMRGNRYQINDPAGGRRLVDEEEFSKAFTGIALEFDVGPGFEPCGSPPGLFRGITTWLRGNRAAATYAILCGFLLAVPGVLLPGFTGAFIDDVVQNQYTPSTVWIVSGMLLLLVLAQVLSLLKGYALNRLVFRMFLMQATRLTEQLLDRPLRFYLQRSPGDLVQRITSNQTIASSLGNQILTNFVSVGTAVVYAAVLVLMDVVVGSVAILGAVLLLLCLRYTNRSLIDRSTKVQREIGRQYGALMGMLRSIAELKATSRESEAFGQWAGYQAKGVNAQQEISRLNAWLDAAPVVLQGAIVYGAVLTLGGWEVMSGRLTIGELVAMQLIAGLLLAPIASIVQLARTLQQTQAEMNRVLDVMDYHEGSADTATARPADAPDSMVPLGGLVELKELSFGFDRNKDPLLRSVSLSVDPGRVLAVVGPSGSGKSTLADLVLGLEEPWSGSLEFDGRPAQSLDPGQRLASLSGTSGTPAIFSGTLRENVGMWDATLSDAEITRAFEDAECSELLKRKGGMDAVVEEGGRNLSGGQRQRLEIARCLAKRPSILVLDGATSALDGRTEARLIDRIRLRGCTVLLVTSRRSTLDLVDEIAILEEGRVAARGGFDELLEANPWFAGEFGGAP